MHLYCSSIFGSFIIYVSFFIGHSNQVTCPVRPDDDIRGPPGITGKPGEKGEIGSRGE